MVHYSNGPQALTALAEAYRSVRVRQAQYEEAQAQADKQRGFLEASQEAFNAARDEAIRLCPELLKGFPVGETVKMVDGQIRVVEEET